MGGWINALNLLYKFLKWKISIVTKFYLDLLSNLLQSCQFRPSSGLALKWNVPMLRSIPMFHSEKCAIEKLKNIKEYLKKKMNAKLTLKMHTKI